MRAFEWDENKSRENIRRRGISFWRAAKIFQGDILEWEDTREDYGETRSIAIGRSERRLVRVVYTLRENRIRIISARMTEENITTLSFDELMADDESVGEQFDQMTDEDIDYSDDPSMTDDELNQFKRAYYVKGEKVWEDEKTIGEWLEEQEETPALFPLEKDILEWFKAQGQDYPARINKDLRAYVEAHR